jgi:FkbM family methyltransferase
MNISAISRESMVGRALRLPLRLIPAAAVVPVLQGPLRGARWVVGSSTHGCWLGTYEHDKQGAFAGAIRPGGVLFDVGAHVGFYTLLGARLARPGGRVVAFEPLPRNLAYLRKHLRLNRIDNVTVIDAAVGATDGIAAFREGPGAGRPSSAAASSSMGRLAEQGEHTVRVVGLDDMVQGGSIPPPSVIKIDVEGGEVGVLRGARAVLEANRPTIFLATHGPDLHRECCDVLSGLGYELVALNGGSVEQTDELMALPGG